jgi:ribosome biogenesis GTPase
MAAPEPALAPAGQVVALQANYCRVVLDEPGPGGVRQLLCTRRSRLEKCGVEVCVGDRVLLAGVDWQEGRAAIAGRGSRTSLLSRPAVANATRLAVVVALRDPPLDPLQLTRFLLSAEATGLPVEVVLTKLDLLPVQAAQGWCRRVRSWGYPVHGISSRSGEGLGPLQRHLAEAGITVLCGPSGVGKSSLLNLLVPRLCLRVAPVSGRLRRGRHTTRHVELFPLGDEALVADTPGFNRPELPGDPQLLAAAFPELRRRLERRACRFSDCRHRGDQGCGAGTDWDRYPLYRRCLEELERAEPSLSRRNADVEELRNRGGNRLEPVLRTSLRRQSRRRTRQDPPEDLDLSPPGQAGSD